MDLGIQLVSLDEIWSNADIISVHTPLNDKTKNLISYEQLSRCKTGVMTINCARGGIVNEIDLLKALKEGKVSAAGLDVFENEPPNFSTGLIQHPSVVSTPHLGASTEEAQQKVAIQIAEQIVAYFKNGSSTGAVNSSGFKEISNENLKAFIKLSEQMGKLLSQIRNDSLVKLSITFYGDLFLASTSSARFIVPVIADSVGFAFHHASHADPKTQLFGYLKEKQVLLLTDNLEDLLTEPGIEVLAELLAHTPQVKLLGTSHEILGLQDEWVFEVQGLPVPENIYEQGSEQNTSVELFLQRARRAHVGYVFTVQDYPSILRICQLVEGMPLGVAIGCGLGTYSFCHEIAHEIERGLDFLTVSARDIPARHRSMRAVFDHSWKRLAEEEQPFLLRLSSFRGGFQREAAETVAGATLSMLSTLVTKSLIRRSGTGRYDLHELIRQFAAEHLAESPEEQSATQASHGRYYLEYFSQADGRWMRWSATSRPSRCRMCWRSRRRWR